MAEAFYEALADGFRATELTRGPWSAEHQHAGPPTALIGREIERAVGPGWQLGRLTLEILEPIPIGEVTVGVRVVRPGRRVQMVECELLAEGEKVVTGRAWLVAERSLVLPDLPQVDITPPLGPAEGIEKPYFRTGQDVGYHTGMEFRFLRGGFLEQGSAQAWLRMRVPLVAGEVPTPLARALVAADTGNGISGVLDHREFLFLNTDLTVSLTRLPGGEWVGLDATTIVTATGLGVADTVLGDERGPIGRAIQTLLVAER